MRWFKRYFSISLGCCLFFLMDVVRYVGFQSYEFSSKQTYDLYLFESAMIAFTSFYLSNSRKCILTAARRLLFLFFSFLFFSLLFAAKQSKT